jgi:glycosyltransferase involved in cell wall biosynthesis
VSRLRVAYVLKMYPRFSETFILNELLELERQGVELHVFSLKRPNDGVAHADVGRLAASVTYLPQTLPGLVAAQWRALFQQPLLLLRVLARAVRRPRKSSIKHVLQAGVVASALTAGRFDHIHAHFASGATSVARHASLMTGVPYSFTAHAKDIFLHTVRPLDIRRKLKDARFAVTVSDFNVDHLAPLATASRVVRIYNGLDLDRFYRNGAQRDNPPLVLAVGRLIEKKGFEDLVRASADLARGGSRFRCSIVGDGALEGRLRGLVAELGVGGFVDLAGRLPRERLLELYPRASVFAAPCVVGGDGDRDGLPTVLIEAMALGVPVVATPVTGIPELVEDGVTGLLVPERDQAALAAAIEKLLADEALAQRLTAAARNRVEEYFDLRRNVGLLRKLFEELA